VESGDPHPSRIKTRCPKSLCSSNCLDGRSIPREENTARGGPSFKNGSFGANKKKGSKNKIKERMQPNVGLETKDTAREGTKPGNRCQRCVEGILLQLQVTRGNREDETDFTPDQESQVGDRLGERGN